jgi:hypothetical protein
MATAKGKRAQAVKAAAKAAGVDISKQLAAAGKKINKDELDAINKRITRKGGTAVSFEDTQSAAKRAASTATPAANNQVTPESYDDYLKRQDQISRDQQRVNWKEFFRTTLTEWGVPQLADQAMQFVDRGFTGDTVILKLQETDTWKQRFAANETRKKKGLSIIDPATYLALESTYESAMRAAGLPKGFYDELSDFTKLIAANVSPATLNERINIAKDFIDTADPFFRNQLKQYYNMNEGDMVAYALDPERALPLLERKANTIKFGAEAARQGLNVGLGSAETYAGMGVSGEQAKVGFEQVAQVAPEAERLSAVFAGQEAAVGQEDVMSAVFTGEGSAEQKRRLQRLSESEQSLFAGQSGVGRGSLGRSQAGQI